VKFQKNQIKIVRSLSRERKGNLISNLVIDTKLKRLNYELYSVLIHLQNIDYSKIGDL